jgi:hypothetical protein
MVYYMPLEFQIYNRKTKKIYSCLMTAYQGGQKNRNGKTTVVIFIMFSTSERKWVLCTLRNLFNLKKLIWLKKCYMSNKQFTP